MCVYFSLQTRKSVYFGPPCCLGFTPQCLLPISLSLTVLLTLAISFFYFVFLLSLSHFSELIRPPPPLLLAVSLFPSLILLSRCLCNVTLPCILENMSIILRS